MPIEGRLEEYASLLRIRQKAYRRDSWLAGGVFFLSLVGVFFYGALNSFFSESLFVVLPVVVALGAGYAGMVARLYAVNASLEMVQVLEISLES